MAGDLDSYLATATASKLGLTTSAAGATSGAAFTTQPVVAIQDSLGNTMTGSSAVVTMTVSTGGTVVGTATATASSGVATFSTVGIGGTAGTSYTLTFSSSLLTSVAQSITPAAGTASKYLATTSSSSPAAGSDVTITAQLADANGNPVATAGQIVTWSKSNGSGSFSAPTSTTDASGIATITFTTHTVAGTGTTVTATDTSNYTGTTATITSEAGLPSQLVLSTSAAGFVSGAAFTTQPVVTIQDANGNPVNWGTTVVKMTVDAGGIVVGTAEVTTTTGIATFSDVGISGTSGTSYMLTFDGDWEDEIPLTAVTQTITPAATATQLGITTQPVGGVSGAVLATQPVIAIQDASGSTVTTDSSTQVTLAIVSGDGGTLGGTLTQTASSGVATFSGVTLTGTVGQNYVLQFTSSPTLTEVDSLDVTVTSAVPTVSDSGGTRTSDEDVPINISGVTVGDVDNGYLTVTVTATSGTITLASTTGLNSLTGQYTSSIRFAATIADANTALAGMTFTPTLDFNGAATFNVSANDGTTTTALGSKTITFAAVNDAPLVTAGGTLAYTETGAAAAIRSTLSITDSDDTHITGASVTISAGLTTGDELGFTPQNGISGSYVAGTGVLTLTGTATLANYQTALRSVTYRSTSGDPTSSSASRTVSWVVTDANSSQASNGAMTSTVGDSITNYLENTVYTLNRGANAYEISMDLGQNWVFEAEYRAIQASVGGVLNQLFTYGSSTDGIVVRTLRTDSLYLKGRSFGRIDIFGGTTTGNAFVPVKIQYTTSATAGILRIGTNGVLINTVTGTAPLNPADKTIRLGTSQTFSGEVRNIKITRQVVNATQSEINIASLNDAPSVTAGRTLNYTENGLAAAIDSGVTVSDSDDTQIAGATVTISAGLTSGDELGFTTQNGIIGFYAAETGVLTLTGTTTLSNYQTALRSVTYRSTSEDPTSSSASRTVSWQVTDANSDGAGAATSVAVTSTMNITAGNDAPVLLAGGTLSYTENGVATVIDSGVSVSDSDDTQIAGATVTISVGRTTGDELGFTPQNGISGSYAAGTGVLTLTGTTTLANYQTALRSVTYLSTSENPTSSSASRTVSWEVTDTNSSQASNGALRSIAGESSTTYLANTVYTLNSNGANPYVISADLGQNWTFEAEYRAILLNNGGLNTLFSYGLYTDGILVRTLRNDALYLKGVNFGNINVFGGTTTGDAFVPVKIQYTTSGNTGTLRIEANGVLIRSVTGTAPLNPADKTIRLGSAHHASNEGFNGQVRNIKITQQLAVTSTQSKINITSVNDAPILAAVTAGTIAEVDQSSATVDVGLTGRLSGSDVDVERLTYGILGETPVSGSVSKAGTYGTLTVTTATGSYAFTKNAPAIEALKVTDSVTDSFSVTVTDRAGASATQTYTVTLTGADDPATQLAFVGQPSAVVAGATMAPVVTVEVRDAYGNRVTTATDTVVLAIGTNPGSGTLSGGTATAAVSGVATFSGLSVDKTGTGYTLSATSGSLTAAISSGFNVTPGSASLTQSTISASSSSITADGTSTSTITVQLKDGNGNNLTTSGGTVVLSSTLGTLGTVNDNSNGTYTAALTSATTVGTATISGTLAGSALTSTASVNLTAGAATQIVLTTTAVGSASGAAFAQQPAVTIRDAVGNTVTSDNSSTVTMSVNSGATVVGTATVTASSGVATFTSVGITGTLGTTYTLTFSSGSFASVSQTITPALLVSGLAMNFNGQGKIIANGNVQSGLGIVFTTGPSSYWDLSGIDLFIGAGSTASPQVFSGGTIRFNLYRLSGGDPTIASSLTWVASSSATVASFNGVGAIQHFNFSALKDLIPNTQYLLGIDVTGSVGTDSSASNFLKIHAVTATPSSTLGWSANAVNSYNLTGVFGSGTSVMGSSYSTLGAGLILYGAPVNSASKLGLTTSASGAASGSAFTTQPVVVIQDANGNTVTSSSAAVTMTVSSDGLIVGTASATAVNGVATFSGVGIRGAAGTSYTLTFESSGLTSVTQLITPTAGSASQLAITTQPVGGASGAALVTQPVVVIRDAYGNTVTTDSSTVLTVAILSGSSGTLGSVITKTAVSGVAAFSGVTLSGLVGQNYVLQFTASTLTSANSGNVTVSSGTATTIALSGGNNQSATVNTAVATAPSVTVTDANGNAVSGVSVTFAVASGGGSIASSGAASTDSTGVATSPVWTLGTTAGANTVTATSGSLSGSPITFAATGTAGAATQLAITTQPVGGASGTALVTQPVVRIRDQYGNTVTTDNSTLVTVAISSGTGGALGVTSSGSLTQTASSGVVAFSGVTLSGTTGQNYVLRFTSSPTLTAANSGNVTVSSGTATTIVVNGGNNQSATVATAVAIAPSVKVTDAQGNAVSGVSVTFAVASGSGSLASSGAVTTDSTGIASSPTWTLGTIAGANTLRVTSAGLTGSPLTITATGTAGAATQLAITTQPVGGASGTVLTVQPAVTVRDQYGNTVTIDGTTVIAVAIKSGTGGTLGGVQTATVTGGVAAFSGVTLAGTVGQNYVLRFSSTPTLTAADSQNVTVSTGASTTIAVNGGNNQSATVATAVAIAPSVKVTDAQGNAVSGVSVTFAVASGSGSLASSGAVTTDSTGIATSPAWTLGTLAGANTLTATSGTLTGSPLTITATGTAGAATQLAITTQPTSVVSGATMNPAMTVEVHDRYGNRVTSSTASIGLAFGNNAGIGTLTGGTAVNASAGLATFGGLSVDKAAAGYTLVATSGTLAGATSIPFNVSVGSASAQLSTLTPATVLLPGDGQSTQVLTVKASDALGNPLRAGGAAVVIRLKSGVGRVGPVTDQGDGSYTAILTAPAFAGVGVVEATLDGAVVKGGGANPVEISASYTDVTAPQISGPRGSTGVNTSQTVPENSLAVHPFTANEPVTWILNGGRDVAKFSLSSSGELTFKAAPNFEAPQDLDRDNVYEVVIRATDAAGNASQEVLSITISDINEVPDGVVLTGTSVAENAGPDAVVGVLQGSDPDRNTVFGYRLVAGVPDNARFNLNGTVLRASQSLDYETQRTYLVKVRVDDGSLFLEQEVLVAVEDRNEAPVVISSIPGKTLTLQQSVSWALPSTAFAEVDAGQSLSYSVSGLPPGILFLPQTKTFTGSPLSVGTYLVQVTAADTGTPALSATATFEIKVERPSIQLSLNPAYLLIGYEDTLLPLASGSSQMVSVLLGDGSELPLEKLGTQNLAVRIVVTGLALDVQGNPKGSLSMMTAGIRTLVRPSAQNPLNIPLQDLTSGQLAFMPAADDYGLRYATVPYRADLLSVDDNVVVSSASGLIYLAIRNVNDAPQALPNSEIALAYRQAMRLNLMSLFSDRDPEDVSRLTYAVDSIGADLDASLIGNELQIKSWALDPSSAEIQITATDPSGASAQATLRVQHRGQLVQPNAAPTVVIWTADQSKPDGLLPAEMVVGNASIILPENRTIAFAARGTDLNLDTLYYGLTGRDAALFTVDVSGRVSARRGFDFENPVDADKSGRYLVAVTVSDGRGGDVVQPVEILVSNVVEPAELRPGKSLNWSIPTGKSGGARSFSIMEFFRNPEGGLVTASVANSAELLAQGITASVQGDLVQITLPAGYSSVGNLQLQVQANGLIQLMEVRLSADFDSDGVDNFTESFAGDRNGDGINDSKQNNVASLPAANSDPGDPASYLSVSATANENSYTSALQQNLSSGGSLSAVLKISAVEVGAVSAQEKEALKRALGGSAVNDIQTDLGLLGFSITPSVETKGVISAVDLNSFEATLLTAFASRQNVVRIVLPVGSHVNTFVKTAGDGSRYEFLKAALVDSKGIPRRGPDGNIFYTGAEFLNTDGDPENDEVLVYFVDNERGDEDPAPGSIQDPGVLAFLARETEIAAPKINSLASPTADRRPRISGTAPAGSTVRIRDGSSIVGTTVANAQGGWNYTPASDLTLSEHVFTAIAFNEAGLISLPSNEVRLLIQNRVVATTDSLVRIPRQTLKWKVEQILANDFVAEGTARLVQLDPLSTQGGTVRLDGGWILYTPPAGLADLVVDSFGYELGNGKETARGRVNLVAQEWTTGLAQNLVRVLPMARGAQLRFAVVPSRKYRVLGRSSLLPTAPWTDLGEVLADEVGRLDLFDPEVASDARFYRLQMIQP